MSRGRGKDSVSIMKDNPSFVPKQTIYIYSQEAKDCLGLYQFGISGTYITVKIVTKLTLRNKEVSIRTSTSVLCFSRYIVFPKRKRCSLLSV